MNSHRWVIVLAASTASGALSASGRAETVNTVADLLNSCIVGLPCGAAERRGLPYADRYYSGERH
jgi:hypothetical protein